MLSRLNSDRLRFTARDERILRFLLENKIASTKQVQRQLFPNASKQACSRRLGILSSRGLVSKRGASVGIKMTTCFELSEKGFKVLSNELGYKLVQEKFRSDSDIHDLTLVDLLEVLRKSQRVTKIVSENALRVFEECLEDPVLRAFASLHSDAYLKYEYNNSSLNLALEYERTPKSFERWLKKVDAYYREPTVHAILVVTENVKIAELLKKVDQRYRKEDDSKLFFCLASDLLKEESMLNFVDSQNRTIRL